MTRIILAILCFSAATSAMCQEPRERAILASVSYCLSEEDVQRYSAEAMAGSAEAATKLANSHWACGKQDIEKTKYWAIIGAENGGAEAQFRAYQTLGPSPNKLDQMRAIFWLKKAAQQKYEDAIFALEDCPDIFSKEPDSVPCYGPGSDK